MTAEQVQALFTQGALAAFTGCDDVAGPCTWAAIRLSDGLAVCTEPVPAQWDGEQAAIRAWMQGAERTWMLVDEAEASWCFARWAFGHGDPAPCQEPMDLLTGPDGEGLLLLTAAVCALAARLYPGWRGTVPTAVDLEVVAVFPMRDGTAH